MNPVAARIWWMSHTVCNALPAAIMAALFVLHTPSQWAAMILTVMVFGFGMPMAVIQRMRTGRSRWSQAIRLALGIRSVISSVSAILLLTVRGTWFVAFPEIMAVQLLEKTVQLLHRGFVHAGLFDSGADDWWESPWFTASLTLATGLTLMVVAGLLAVLIRGVFALASWNQRTPGSGA